jgi:hypothetical protein
MSLENGLPAFRILPLPKFERSFKALKKGFKSKRQGEVLVTMVQEIFASLRANPRHPDSRMEPTPKGVDLPDGGEFRKLLFDMPGLSGASGEGRLMYIVDFQARRIQLVWIYTHEEYKGRPPDKDLRQILQEALEVEDEA